MERHKLFLLPPKNISHDITKVKRCALTVYSECRKPRKQEKRPAEIALRTSLLTNESKVDARTEYRRRNPLCRPPEPAPTINRSRPEGGQSRRPPPRPRPHPPRRRRPDRRAFACCRR